MDALPGFGKNITWFLSLSSPGRQGQAAKRQSHHGEHCPNSALIGTATLV